MTEITPETLQQSSEYAQELLQQGFRPNEVNIEAMLAQMDKLQRTVDALNAERGVPIDAVDGHRKHLLAHVKVRDSGRPDVDMSELHKVLAMLPEVSDHITAGLTEAIHFAVEQLLKTHPGKELEYLGVLASELHQMVLNREGRSGNVHDRLAELEKALADTKAELKSLHAEMHPAGASNG